MHVALPSDDEVDRALEAEQFLEGDDDTPWGGAWSQALPASVASAPLALAAAPPVALPAGPPECSGAVGTSSAVLLPVQEPPPQHALGAGGQSGAEVQSVEGEAIASPAPPGSEAACREPGRGDEKEGSREGGASASCASTGPGSAASTGTCGSSAGGAGAGGAGAGGAGAGAAGAVGQGAPSAAAVPAVRAAPSAGGASEAGAAAGGAGAPPALREHVEEFTGLRIAKRCVTALQWHDEIRGKGRRVVLFRQLHELAQRQRACDKVVVGVLYDKLNTEKLANGENFACWGLTDLAEPIPRLLKLQLRWDAFQHWRSRQAAATATRGSIFAIMNPTLVEDGKGCVWGSEPVIRVERASQLHKLGESPSLGRCDMRGCPLPCNTDLGDRFCHLHLSRAYADKPGRIVAGGGASSSSASLLNSRRRYMPKPRASAPGQDEEEEEERAGRGPGGATAVKTTVAVQFDDRRFHHSEANQNYVRSICAGARPEGHETSRVPVLGRGLEDRDGLEIDFATVDSEELRKAQRMLEQRAGRAGRGAARDAPAPASLPPAKRPRAAPDRPPAPRPALGQLLEALAVRRTARRSGAAGASAGGPPGARGAPAGAGAGAAGGRPAPGGQEGGAPSAAPTSAEEVLRGLEAAGSQEARLREALQAAGVLAAGELHGEAGRRLYEAVGRLTLERASPELRQLALRTRRRWRAQSDAAADRPAGEAAAAPSDAAMDCPTDAAAAAQSDASTERPAGAAAVAQSDASADCPAGAAAAAQSDASAECPASAAVAAQSGAAAERPTGAAAAAQSEAAAESLAGAVAAQA